MPADRQPPIRILHLDDNPRDAELIAHRLEAERVDCEIRLACSAESFHAALEDGEFDLVLCDYNLPGYDGLSALRKARDLQPRAPVIIISGTVDDEEAVKSLHAGATDYVLKEHLERLAPAVRRAIQESEDRRRRAEAEAALLQRERRLSSIYQAAADGLFLLEVGPDGSYWFASANPAFLDATGCAEDAVIGKRIEAVLSEPALSAARSKFTAAIRDRRVMRWQETTRYPKGVLASEMSIAPVFDATGACTHLVGALHDVTARRLLEAQLRQAQKMESVGQLAGGIAHDFNNLLTIINATAELALAELEPGQDQLASDLCQIAEAGGKAAALTRQLLAFSRKQILSPRVFDLSVTVVELGKMLRRLLGEDVKLTITPAPVPAPVLADPGQIEQVIVNLAVNARDAMPGGGSLTMETRVLDSPPGAPNGRLADAAGAPRGYVTLSVADTGCGMDDETRRRIFEPFFTTKGLGKGTGLGLSTAYGIVKQSGGFLQVDSQPGKGSCFTMHLPLSPEADSTDQATPPGAPSAGTETILVVEDVTGLRQLIVRTLESAGYAVHGAGSASEALEWLAGGRRRPDLLLTDVVMPDMSGRVLAERMDGMHPGVKVLFMSGFTDDVVLRHGVQQGVAFIAKPFSTADLLRRIREVLEAPENLARGA